METTFELPLILAAIGLGLIVGLPGIGSAIGTALGAMTTVGALKKRKENPITTSAKALRREVVQEIKTNPQEYVDFFTWDQESVKPQKPLQKKSLPKGWVKKKSAKRNKYYYFLVFPIINICHKQ